ncbi:Lariat debranching enzyme [Babesia sp. Xinjiang]|uniref:Lariat debranching enzyme n=1 Tax=Babesia sp. Xinjiang TaxID=462227 RepID=UPI000A23D538|nr:Lariat debranching enzyme [Babesia sp. Xinjiang]ORM41762.1 Lariat debranching enzyme [Babesia sp. Xinjiang]
MHVAVEGCVHGELDLIYAKIKEKEEADNIKVDLLLCCGDFQAIRNESDLEDLACPPKYKHYRDFREYYNGTKVAPILTIFVGGNHEAPAFLKDLYFGGWVAKNIYYMGHSGVVNVNGLRIAGLSGIYDSRDYTRGFFETAPYDESTKRSAYHIREYDVKKLLLLEKPIDIFLSHDWPQGIERSGDVGSLIRRKPHLRFDIEKWKLGNPYTWELLTKLQPRYWFAAHLHVRFEATVQHEKGSTYFLALDKPLPRRQFIEFMSIPPLKNQKRKQDDQTNLCYDLEWLAILATNTKDMPLNAFPSSVEINLKKPDEETAKRVMDALAQQGCETCTIDGETEYKVPEPIDEWIYQPAKQRESLLQLLDIADNTYFTPKSETKFQVKFK